MDQEIIDKKIKRHMSVCTTVHFIKCKPCVSTVHKKVKVGLEGSLLSTRAQDEW